MKSNCVYCNKEVDVIPFKIKQNKIGIFCSPKCHDDYNRFIWRKVRLICPTCKKEFMLKRGIYKSLLRRFPNHNFYCSKICHNKSMDRGRGLIKTFTCTHCGKSFLKPARHRRNNKFTFCNMYCRASYFARQRKILGKQRSVLEQKIEEHIKHFFPFLAYVSNDRETLKGLELDFYFPDLKIAIEVNGPSHFKPIWSEESFRKTKRNDMIKRSYCKIAKIDIIYVTDILDRKNDNSFSIFFKNILPILSNLVVDPY